MISSSDYFFDFVVPLYSNVFPFVIVDFVTECVIRCVRAQLFGSIEYSYIVKSILVNFLGKTRGLEQFANS